MLSAKGESTTVTLSSDEHGERSNGHLLVSSCGPMIRVGQRSIAVGMGNVVKIITVGHDRFNIGENSDDMAQAMSGRRRKLAAARKRSLVVIDSDVLLESTGSSLIENLGAVA